MTSIIIAAHDEASVLGTTLDALLRGTDAADLEVIVAANGCSDETAACARDRGVRVIELAEAGKAQALNAGDLAATSFPRIYLDADIIVPPTAVQKLTAALNTGAMAAVPNRVLNLDARPLPVRAYFAISERLPAFREGLFGRGMIALSAVGRARFGAFPDMVADDLYLDSLFTAREKVHVDDVSVSIDTPLTTRNLLRRLTRVRRGNAALREASRTGAIESSVRRPHRWSWLRDVVLPHPWLAPAGVCYVALTSFAALLARRGPVTSLAWGRDDSTRQARTEERLADSIELAEARGRVGFDSSSRQGMSERRERQVMKVGFLGIQPGNPNLGVAALAYSVVGMVDRLLKRPAEFILFSENSAADLSLMAETLDLSESQLIAAPIRHKNPRALFDCVRVLRECSVVIDLTGGDSFSDIYGLRRLLVKLVDKQLVLFSRRPLVIAPQTIGPFRNRFTLPWVRHIVDNAALVLTRDRPSYELLKGLTGREVALSTDVAVTLPWHDTAVGVQSDRTRVAFNTSGLLWNGGYTGDNQFGLRADYRTYCRLVVDRLRKAGCEVHLISHVTAGSKEIPEDDLLANYEVLADFPDCILAPGFASPVEAKSYIAGMDVFIGARLHATIASLTSGVPTIPVAYSRKFAGFFGNLGYSNVIDMLTLDEETAAELTLALVQDRVNLKAEVTAANEVAQQKVQKFVDRLAGILRVMVR